jgi:hypothetical protein
MFTFMLIAYFFVCYFCNSLLVFNSIFKVFQLSFKIFEHLANLSTSHPSLLDCGLWVVLPLLLAHTLHLRLRIAVLLLTAVNDELVVKIMIQGSLYIQKGAL